MGFFAYRRAGDFEPRELELAGRNSLLSGSLVAAAYGGGFISGPGREVREVMNTLRGARSFEENMLDV